MFFMYNLKTFGNKIAEVRVKKGLTQIFVSRETGINIDTIRKIENGYCLPRLDTIANLSTCFGVDILELIYSEEINEMLKFYCNIDKLITKNDVAKLTNVYNDFLVLAHKIRNSDSIFSLIELRQLELYSKALSLRYSLKYKQALKSAFNALKITFKDIDFSDLSKNDFSELQLRIICLITSIYGDMRNLKISNIISESIIKKINTNSVTKFENSIIIKLYAQLSYNYYREDDFKLSLYFSDKGIKESFLKSNIEILHYLLFRKGVAQFKMKDSSSVNSFILCLQVLEFRELSDTYIQYNKIIQERYSNNQEALGYQG